MAEVRSVSKAQSRPEISLWYKLQTATRLSLAAAMAIAGLTLAKPALADSAGVPFYLTIYQQNACFIFVRRTGILQPNATYTVLDSALPGGRTGIADIYSFQPYQVRATAVPFFLPSPVGGSTNVTATASFRGEPRLATFPGGSWLEQDGTVPAVLPNGTSYTRVNINLRAERPTPFPAGSYTGHVVLTCE